MTLAALEWLPRDAYSDDRIQAALSKKVGAWFAAWSKSSDTVEIVPYRAVPDGKYGTDQQSNAKPKIVDADHDQRLSGKGAPKSYKIGGNSDVLRVTGHDATVALAALVFGANVRTMRYSTSDRQLLDKFANRMTADLAARMTSPSGNDLPGSTSWRFKISIAKTTLFTISFGKSFATWLLRSQIAAAHRTQMPVRREVAIAQSHVVLVASLGVASVPVIGLKELEVGDVIVLDNPADGGVEIRVGQTGSVLGTARLQNTGGHPVLHF